MIQYKFEGNFLKKHLTMFIATSVIFTHFNNIPYLREILNQLHFN